MFRPGLFKRKIKKGKKIERYFLAYINLTKDLKEYLDNEKGRNKRHYSVSNPKIRES